MDNYDRYDKINENIEVFNLDGGAVMHFRNMLERLKLIKEKDAAGNLTDEDVREKETLIADMDSFVDNFIQTKKSDIEKEIEKFRVLVEKTNKKFENIKASFVLGDGLDINIPEMLKELENDLEYLIGEAKALISLIDEFKTAVSGYTDVEFTTNYNQIQEDLKYLKTLLKEIKQNQIDRYNARVDGVNKDIDELKSLTPEELDKLPQEVRERIMALQTLSSCDFVVSSYNSIKYMSELDYNKLVQTILEITQIKSSIGKDEPKIDAELDAEIDWIEDKVQEIEGKLKDEMSKEEIEELHNEIANVSERTVEFETKINNLKDQLKDKFDEYFGRVNDAQANLAELNNRLIGLEKPPVTIVDGYRIYLEKLNLLEGEVNSFSTLVESLFGKVLVAAVEPLEARYNTLNGRVEEIEKDIDKAYEEKKLDQNQYEQLKQQIERIRKTLDETKGKIKNPEIAKDIDVFTFLNGQITGIEDALNALEKQIDELEKPIKDKATRKAIDKAFAAIEKEIKDVEKMLEKYKDQDPEKYEAAKARLDGLKERLDKVGKNYRKKCPLLVRAIKSAKNFYKKHKKLCLIVAGLAAIALIHATVGPILIPAIMHGNIMIGQSVPALGGFTSFVNNILGGMIGATQKATGSWILANGVRIAPSMASTSLLKGLAISGLGSAALLAPLTAGVVVGIKKLMTKMKKTEKETEKKEEKHEGRKIGTAFRATKDRAIAGKEKIKEKINNIIKKRKNPDKKTYKELEEILKDIKKSGMSLEEYCEEHEFSDEQKAALAYFIAQANQRENEEEIKRSGR